MTREKAINYLINEAKRSEYSSNHDKLFWTEKLKQLDILPDWYLKMFWYETYTEILKLTDK